MGVKTGSNIRTFSLIVCGNKCCIARNRAKASTILNPKNVMSGIEHANQPDNFPMLGHAWSAIAMVDTYPALASEAMP